MKRLLEVIGLRDIRCYRHVASSSVTPLTVICHVFMHCLGSFPQIARYVFILITCIFLRGTKYKIFRERVAYFAFQIVMPRPLFDQNCLQVLVLITDNIFVLVRFSSEKPQFYFEEAICLFREVLSFLQLSNKLSSLSAIRKF